MKSISLITLLLLLTATQDLLPMHSNLLSNHKTPREHAIIITEEIKLQTDNIEKLEHEALNAIGQFNNFRNTPHPIQSSSTSQIMDKAIEKFKTAKEKISQSIEKKQNMIDKFLIPIYQAKILLLDQEEQEPIGLLIKNNIKTMQTKIAAEKKLLEPFKNTVGLTYTIKKSESKSDPEMESFIGRIIDITACIAVIGLIGWCIYIYKSNSENINYFLFTRA
jgi:hypothetical protein